MRIALISALKRADNGELRSEKRLAGRSILEWQVDLALKLKCERIICLCDANHGAVIDQQRRIESEGRGFYSVRNHLQLVSLVRGDDELLVQLDGLIVGGEARELVESSGDEALGFVFVIPADHRLSAEYSTDFERIDRERHWAGIAQMPGDCALQLGNFPADGDAISLLLRLALQSKVPCKEVPNSMLETDQWATVIDNDAIARRTQSLIKSSAPEAIWSGPGDALAAYVVRATAPYWLRSGSEISAGLAVAGMIVAGIIAAFGFGPAGLSVGALSAVLARLSANSGQLRMGVSAFANEPAAFRIVGPAVLCLAMVALIVAHTEASTWPVRIGIPFIAMGLAWLAHLDSHRYLRAFWRDLPTHLAVFAIAASFGALQEVLLAFALGALLQLMLRSRHQ